MTTKPEACIVCLESDPEIGLVTRQCCSNRVCQPCLQKYVNVSIKSSIRDVKCPNDTCHVYIAQSDVHKFLDQDNIELYCQLKVDHDESKKKKTCPNCKHVTSQPNKKAVLGLKKITAIKCEKCQFEWCYDCHSPLHPGSSCRENKKADEAFVVWTSENQGGQRNARKCPNCKIYIQRSGGCRHMTCSKCNKSFCYDCGKTKTANNACGCRRKPDGTAVIETRRQTDRRPNPPTITPDGNRGRTRTCCLPGRCERGRNCLRTFCAAASNSAATI